MCQPLSWPRKEEQPTTWHQFIPSPCSTKTTAAEETLTFLWIQEVLALPPFPQVTSKLSTQTCEPTGCLTTSQRPKECEVSNHMTALQTQNLITTKNSKKNRLWWTTTSACSTAVFPNQKQRSSWEAKSSKIQMQKYKKNSKEVSTGVWTCDTNTTKVWSRWSARTTLILKTSDKLWTASIKTQQFHQPQTSKVWLLGSEPSELQDERH